MKRIFTLGLALLTGTGGLLAQNQDPVALKYGNMITPADLKEYLNILASDAFEGRETGKRGQKVAAAFISANFQDFGLTGPVDGGYYQYVELYTSLPGNNYIKAGQRKFVNFEDAVYYGNADTGGELTTQVVFVGKGRVEDLDQVDVAGKAVMILAKTDENYREAVTRVREKGAKIVIVVNPDPAEFASLAKQFKSFSGGGSLSLKRPEPNNQNPGLFFLAPKAAEALFSTTLEKLVKAAAEDVKKGALKKIKPVAISYATSIEIKVTKVENVLGYLEGSDKKDEVVVITAHYDHIGRRSSGEGDLINNGADDDGSGTTTVIELSKIFAQAKKDGKGPRRSMLFMTVSGEEKGLLGSEYYSEHPIFPLDKTVVDLNIDMVGRRDPQHKDSAPYVYVIGSDKLSTELHNINEAANKTYTNLIFDYTYNDQNHPERLYYRSDHWNFAKKNIPIIFYFDGIHEDYHKPSDEISKIEFDLLAKRAQNVFYTAWEIVNREQRIAVDKK